MSSLSLSVCPVVILGPPCMIHPSSIIEPVLHVPRVALKVLTHTITIHMAQKALLLLLNGFFLLQVVRFGWLFCFGGVYLPSGCC